MNDLDSKVKDKDFHLVDDNIGVYHWKIIPLTNYMDTIASDYHYMIIRCLIFDCLQNILNLYNFF